MSGSMIGNKGIKAQLVKACQKEVEIEESRHRAKMEKLTTRYGDLLDALDFDGLTSCPECGAMTEFVKNENSLSWYCESDLHIVRVQL